MPDKPTPDDIIEKLNRLIVKGIPIIADAAGSSLFAKGELDGGVDLIVADNTGHYYDAGVGPLAGLLAYGDANQIVLDKLTEIQSVVGDLPLLAGVNGSDPCRDIDAYLDSLIKRQVTGVQNYPSIGLIDGEFRQKIEQSGMSYQLEIDMVGKASDKGMLAMAYVFSELDAAAMADAGADIIVCHLGLPTSETSATPATGLDACAVLIDTWADAAMAINPEVMVLAHGGPMTGAADADHVFSHTNRCHGFFGASLTLTAPDELALSSATRAFKAIRKTA